MICLTVSASDPVFFSCSISSYNNRRSTDWGCSICQIFTIQYSYFPELDFMFLALSPPPPSVGCLHNFYKYIFHFSVTSIVFNGKNTSNWNPYRTLKYFTVSHNGLHYINLVTCVNKSIVG